MELGTENTFPLSLLEEMCEKTLFDRLDVFGVDRIFRSEPRFAMARREIWTKADEALGA